MDAEVIMRKQAYAGLLLVTLATSMLEILLTRIFSVTMWYHFAFVAVSVAMFGMTMGAILVYLFPQYFTRERAKYHLALNSFLFAVSIVLSFLTLLRIPFVPDKSIIGLYSNALTYMVISVPFVFSGICVCLALTKFPRQVSRLYAADLTGAALGCILLIYTLDTTDGPTAVIVVASIASVGAFFFASEGGSRLLMRIALILGLLFAAFAGVNTILLDKQHSLLPLTWVKGEIETRPLYEKWNSFSRIRVTGDPNEPRMPFGWGLSSTYPSDRKVRQLGMNIDGTAGSIMTAFQDSLEDLEYLKYDVTNLCHYIRRDSKVLVVGPGGGRDILSSLVFEQKSVLGVEMNKAILDAVNQRFGDFTGHLDRNPRVTFVNDEARSYIARQKDGFDIIQVSLIDTWAATAAGAFVLAENSLYTIEAWKVFLNHLNPNGVLTFSRWYFRDSPGEMYRLTSLACASLMQLGVQNPRKHMIIARHMAGEAGNLPDGVGTIIISKEPFLEKDLDTIEQVTDQMRFDLVLTPRFSLDSTFAALASGKDLDTFTAKFPINISAPTDDSPFFFHMLRLRNVFDEQRGEQGAMNFNMKAVSVLGSLLIDVAGLTLLCMLVPLILTTRKATLKGASPLILFFAGIGFGFMLVEISQMQRLIVFLGHPTYGLSVVLFALLLSSGLGSYSTQRVDSLGTKGSATVRLFLLLCALTVFGILTPYVISVFQGSTTTIRVLVATAILFPLGFFMGMAFPLGMKLASTKSGSIAPWLWGINGATSVCASVFAIAIALNFSISTSFWTGFSCYVVAFVAFVRASRGNGRP